MAPEVPPHSADAALTPMSDERIFTTLRVVLYVAFVAIHLQGERAMTGRVRASGNTVLAAHVAALLAAPMPTALAAESRPAAGGLEEITVTARKREEALQDVPLVINAFTGDKLQRHGVTTLRGLSNLTAGLVISDLGAEAQSSPIIRGISQTNILRNGENNVSSFVDGVYIYNLNAINLSVMDLERIEVVKGPVSALYGRNSFAGAINYITRKPSLSDTEVRSELTAGSDEKRRIVGAINLPVVEGRLGVGLSGVYDSFAGTYEDEVNGNSLGGYIKRGGQLSFAAAVGNAVDLNGAVYVGNDELDQAPATYLVNNCAVSRGVPRKFCGEMPDAGSMGAPEAVTATAVPFTGNTRDVTHANLHVTFELGALTLESVTGLNDVDSVYFSEFNKRRDGFTYPVAPTGRSLTTNTFFGRETNTRDYSQELRLASGTDGPLSWQVGAFYYNLDLDTATLVAVDTTRLTSAERIAGPASIFASPTGEPREGRAKGGTEQYSAFAVLEYQFTDRLKLSAEGRYTDEKKNLDQISSATGAPDIDGSGRSDSWSFVDTRLTLNYQLTPTVLTYVSAAKGTKAGGFNDSATIPSDYTYDPESNWTYELGSKTTWLDDRLLLNAAVFYVDWDKPQLQRPSSDPNNPAVQIGNVGKARAYGAELETAFAASDMLRLRVGLAYNDVKFGSDTYDVTSGADCALIPSCATSRLINVGGLPATDLDGLMLPRQSKLHVTAGIDVEDSTATGWRWFGGVDYAHLSKQYFENSNFAWWGPRDTVNARLGVANGRLRVWVWGENLTDDDSPVNAESNLRLTDFVFETLPILPEQRTYGVTLTYAF
jgi:iron complex outermembrane receptor protein